MQLPSARNRNALAIFATLLFVICGLYPMLTAADVEDNSSIATAEAFSAPGSVSGHLNSSTDKDDIYKFQVVKGTIITAVVQPDTNLGVNLYLWQQQGTGANAKTVEVASDRAATVGISYGVPRSINYTCNSTYDSYWMYAWVGFYKSSTNDGTYTLTVGTKAQNDAGSGTDASEFYPNATLIVPGSYKGYVAPADYTDIYKLVLVKGDGIYVTVQPEKALSVNIYLLREINNDGIISYEELTKDKRTTEEGRGQMRHVSYVLNSRENTTKMYVKVYRDQAFGNYSLDIKVDHQNDGGCGADSGDDSAHPCLIKISGNSPGFLKATDVVDYYQFNLSDRMRLFVNITPQNTMSIAVTLFVNGNQISEDRAKHPDLELGTTRRANYTVIRTHDLYKAILKVELDSGNGNYTIATSFVPKPVDKTAPVVVLTDPVLPKREVKKIRIYNFKGTATDFNEISHIELSFDQITWFNTTLSGNLGQYNWNFTVRIPLKGNNTLYIRATDDQGNMGVTGYYVTYREEPKKGFIPGFESVALVAVVIVAAAMVGRRMKR